MGENVEIQLMSTAEICQYFDEHTKMTHQLGLQLNQLMISVSSHHSPLLRYDILELWEMGRGCRSVGCGSCRKESECFAMQGRDLASAYVLCPRLGTGCLYLQGREKEGDEESSRGVIFGGIYVDYKLRNIYKISSPFILQERGLVIKTEIEDTILKPPLMLTHD